MTMNKKTDYQFVPILPDARVCRAAELTNSFALCLVKQPRGCTFAMPWGYEFLCGNPERATIIADTKHEQEGNIAPIKPQRKTINSNKEIQE